MRISHVVKLNVLASTLLCLVGATLPAIAQSKPSLKPDALETLVVDETVDAADIQQLVTETMMAEMQHWSPAEKAAFQQIQQLGLKESELEALAALSASELNTQMKANEKLGKLSATGLSAEEMQKLIPAALLSRYLFNIGRAAVWGGVVASIRSADFDYGAMSQALTTGNTRQFMSLLGEGMSGQGRFVRMVGTAATFACGSATLDFTPGLCDRFASGMTKIFDRVERSGRRRSRGASTLPMQTRENTGIEQYSAKH